MTKRVRRADPLESTLARLRALRDDPGAPAALEELERALGDRSAHAVAAAAQIAAAHELAALETRLAEAFARFLDAPERDPGCVAKSALAEALVRIGCERGELLLRGARHVQREPVWGKRIDTAAAVRGACAMALVRCGHDGAYGVAAELLADPETPARAGAAEALGSGAPVVAAPLLRLKIAAGDPEPRVLGECFASLLRVDPAAGVEIVGRRLEAEPAVAPEVAELAALALGECQAAGALERLRAWYERTTSRALRRTALAAIALLRSDEALAHLVGLVEEAPRAGAEAALEALSAHRGRRDVRERVLAAAERRGDGDLLALARERFAEDG